MSDVRKKGCPNERCIQFFNKVKHSSDINYCPKCGTKLIYVCSKWSATIKVESEPRDYAILKVSV